MRLRLPNGEVTVCPHSAALHLLARVDMLVAFKVVGQRIRVFISVGSDSPTYTGQGEIIANQLKIDGISQVRPGAPGAGDVDLAAGYSCWLGTPVRTAASFLWASMATIGLLLLWTSTRHLMGEHFHPYTAPVLLLPSGPLNGDPSPGGIALASRQTSTVFEVPRAEATVLFRSLPWEVRSVTQAFALLEAPVLGSARLRAGWAVLTGRVKFNQTPLTVTALTYVPLFSVSLVSLGDFGILVRQRMEMIALLVLVPLRLFQDARVFRAPQGDQAEPSSHSPGLSV